MKKLATLTAIVLASLQSVSAQDTPNLYERSEYYGDVAIFTPDTVFSTSARYVWDNKKLHVFIETNNQPGYQPGEDDKMEIGFAYHNSLASYCSGIQDTTLLYAPGLIDNSSWNASLMPIDPQTVVAESFPIMQSPADQK